MNFVLPNDKEDLEIDQESDNKASEDEHQEN